MIAGTVTEAGIPVVTLRLGDRECTATIDTGFNGDLELSETLRASIRARFVGRVTSALAGGQQIEEDAYLVQLVFDGALTEAVATFVNGDGVLLGTNLLRNHRLRIGFKSHNVTLEREV